MLLKDNTGYDISNLAAKKYFITLKVGVDKLDIDKLINLSSGLSNLKTMNLNVNKSKTVSVDLKKISDAVNKEVAKKKLI